ncbi:hypothetical protein PHYBLDRAFT_102179 [Rhizophagus irregularis DAOM 181602=DAOM 197198]|nr:hypothetical protein PHYBLDRAFT_102179 [Rhizophagus irregularis DAOM 181602=DAOM 197198]
MLQCTDCHKLHNVKDIIAYKEEGKVAINELPGLKENENNIYSDIYDGPKEAGLERINHYLAPIVDELLEFWKGWKVPKTHQFSNGLEIKVALIVGSSDTPATRKLFGHGSAVMNAIGVINVPLIARNLEKSLRRNARL